MLGWHANGITQLPNPSYTEKKTGALALAHWQELASRIPKSWRDNPYSKAYPGRFHLQIIELSAFTELLPG